MLRRKSRLTTSTVVLAFFAAGVTAKMAHVHPHAHSGSCEPGVFCPIEHAHEHGHEQHHRHDHHHDGHHHHAHHHGTDDQQSSDHNHPQSPCDDDCIACQFLTIAAQEVPPAAELETQHTSQAAPVLSALGPFDSVPQTHFSRGPPAVD